VRVILSEAKNLSFHSYSHGSRNNQRCLASLDMTEILCGARSVHWVIG